jgi:hypothetical protein
MGLHTGYPDVRDNGYVGLDVHRVARIAACAHGGQVVVSQATRELAGDRAAFRDLGEHRLKDIPEPEWLFQAGEGEFPPLRSLSISNLPAPATPLVGRLRELGDVSALVGAEGTRLVTLTGPGGIGKTRLALAVAEDVMGIFPNGVFVVALAAVTEAALVVPTIAQALGVTEQPDEPPPRTLARRLEQRTVLVVIDNVEQVLDAAVDLAELLEAAPGLSVLATSREPLHIRGEREYALPPLAADEALGLFVERAQAVRADFALDERGRPQRIDHPGYGPADAFYRAGTKANAVRTCNAVAAGWLRLAGGKASLWPPLVNGLTWRYRRQST